MTVVEYNELVDLLHFGHELGFAYNNVTYYLEFVGNNSYEFYNMTEENNGELICKIVGKDMDDVVALFLDKPIIEGKSFNEIYPYLEYVDVD